MISTLWTAATGMKTQQTNIDVTSNNLANVNTGGFKKTKVNFSDLMYRQMREPGDQNEQGGQVAVGVELGHGSKVASTQKIFTAGNIQETGNPLDLLIEGEGFFRIEKPDGSYAYTKNGSFNRDSEGNIVTSEGYLLDSDVDEIPEDTTNISITADGQVNAEIAGDSGDIEELGEITLYRFANPAGLNSAGNNLFEETPATGDPQEGTPGEDGFGTLSQGFLEMSNVKVVEEMVNMISAQRAYDVNSKAIQSADEMLKTANQLKR